MRKVETMSHLMIFLALASGTLIYGTFGDMSNYEMAHRTYFEGAALLTHWLYTKFISKG